jgi:hypothetical protein
MEVKFGPLGKNDKKRLTSLGMRFFTRSDGCTLLGRKRNEEILEELEVETVDEKIRRYKSNWLRYGTRMNNNNKNNNWMPKQMLNFRTNGRRRLGRRLKTPSDEAEAGLSRSNS